MAGVRVVEAGRVILLQDDHCVSSRLEEGGRYVQGKLGTNHWPGAETRRGFGSGNGNKWGIKITETEEQD